VIVSAGTVVTPERAGPGWVAVEGRLIVAVGDGPAPSGSDVELGDRVLVPGFVDIHVHGGGGGSFTDLDPASARRAVAFHRAHGTTTTLASLVTASPRDLLAGVRMLGELVAEGGIAGIHLEGPWLSEHRCGAHEPALLRDPDPAELATVLAAGDGTVRMVTLAPERAGALDAIRAVVHAGAVAAVGHTDTDLAGAQAAIDAGATVATHLFNAMPVIHHRDPGPVVALLNDPRVTTELIVDGTHVDPALYRMVDAAARDTVALVTDAMAAAGAADGHYRLGSLAVTVSDGVARLDRTGSIAGSTATMDRVFATAVAALPLPRAEALVVAARQAATIPARAVGLTDTGALAPGLRADLVALTPDLTVDRVMTAGHWLPAHPADVITTGTPTHGSR
jgi:N-acetylglucosamine-6-phosphate deacetylase